MLARFLFRSPTQIARGLQMRNGTSIPVILMQDIEYRGKKGEVIKVKRGYARNYLIPRKIAVYAIPENKAKFAVAPTTHKPSQEAQT